MPLQWRLTYSQINSFAARSHLFIIISWPLGFKIQFLFFQRIGQSTWKKRWPRSPIPSFEYCNLSMNEPLEWNRIGWEHCHLLTVYVVSSRSDFCTSVHNIHFHWIPFFNSLLRKSSRCDGRHIVFRASGSIIVIFILSTHEMFANF